MVGPRLVNTGSGSSRHNTIVAPTAMTKPMQSLLIRLPPSNQLIAIASPNHLIQLTEESCAEYYKSTGTIGERLW